MVDLKLIMGNYLCYTSICFLLVSALLIHTVIHLIPIKLTVLLLSRAFDVGKHGYLTFRDVLNGLAAMEPSTQHGNTPAEMRCRYIFRYYNQSKDALLKFDEFK